MKLLCLHQAGGSPSLFTAWSQLAPPEVDVVPLALPTDGTGLRERRRWRCTDDLVPVLSEALEEEAQGEEYVLFGHSMGGLLAYLLTRRLCERGGPRPRALVVACYGAPQLVRSDMEHRNSSPEQLTRWLHRLGGIPDWLAAEPELLVPHLGLLRDDLEVCATYRYLPQPEPLGVPVHVFGATEDRLFDAASVRGWASIADEVTTTFLPGGHYLVSDDGDALRKSVFDVTTEYA